MVTSKKKVAFCPECGHNIKLGSHPYEGQQILCGRCRADLEVVELEPLELDVSVSNTRKGGRRLERPKRSKFKQSWYELEGQF
jgi:lysine biosynthesis protein LysW